MTGWARASFTRICGRCAARIPKGAPIFVIELSQVGQTKIRCESCAGVAVPLDLPLVKEQAPIVPLPMHRFDQHSLPLDFKVAAAGEDG